jgi:AraC-like DNA-binding protein
MESMLKVALEISLSPNIRSAMYSSSEINLNDSYLFSQINQQLKAYSVSNSFLDYFYIYFKNKARIISYDTFCTPEDFYKNTYSKKNTTYEEWINSLNDNKIQYIPIEAVQVSSKEDGSNSYVNKTISYIQPLPTGSRISPYATLVMLVNEAKFYNSLIATKPVDVGDIFIIDEKNNIISTTNKTIKLPKEIDYNSFNSSDISYVNWNNSKMAISNVTSEKLKWKYVYIIPEEIFLNKVRYINQITFIAMIFCLLLGTFVSYFFSRKNYNPINRLINKISNTFEINFEAGNEEFNFIEKTLDIAFKERKLIDEKLKQQNYMLKYNFLVKLLKGKIDNSKTINESLTSFDINFNSNYFSVMLFYIEDFEEYFSEDKENISTNEKMITVEFILSKVIEEVTADKNKVFVFEIDGTIACLINFTNTNFEVNINELNRIARDTQRFIQNKMHIYFSVSFSGIHENIEGISISYREAVQAMEYKIIKEDSSIINYSTIENSEYKYDYSMEIELQLINYIKTGNYDMSEQVLREVFDKNFANNNLSIKMIKCLMFDIMSTIVKTVGDIMSNNNLFIDEINPVETLIQCENVKDMKVEILDILKKVCDYINENKKKHTFVLRDQIIEFIKENYAQVDLDVSMVANHFDLNNSYLSKYFKEASGQGLLDYITSIRIKNAKILLREQGMNVSDAAIKTGFYNSNSFIRTFKKYEGVTPGKYKEMI